MQGVKIIIKWKRYTIYSQIEFSPVVKDKKLAHDPIKKVKKLKDLLKVTSSSTFSLAKVPF